MPYFLAIVAGAILWTLTAVVGGRTEPWDASGYWTLAYPAAILLAAVLGYLFPRKARGPAALLVFMQALVMFLSGSGLSLLPLGLLFLGVLSIPAIVVAWVAARVRLYTARG